MFRIASLLTFATLAVTVYGQQAGNLTTETHPKLPWQLCRKGGSCTNQSTGEVALDSNWRWLHHTANYTNCYEGNEWNTQYCPNAETCARNCAVDGADYRATYGITVSGNALTLKFVTEGEYSTNIGSRVYLMNGATKYQMFKLMNKEFTFDVDLSNLPCGLNGALYFVEMPEDGGLKGGNKAGAKFGTGYCDAQCPHDMKFIEGMANVDDWKPSATDQNAGTGKYGTCCAEMDIWEANSMGTAYTPHTCAKNGLLRCSSPTECGDTDTGNRYDGNCDKDGCDFNSFRMGEKKFYGRGADKTIDSTKKMTVITQFISTDGTDNGDLKEIRRAYVQGGKVIWNSKTNIPGMDPYDSITDDFCHAQKAAFGDKTHYMDLGGNKGMGGALKRGMVLALSLWGDHAAHMLWLDSNYPLDKDPSVPGVARGECSTDSGDPADLESSVPGSSVIFSNIKFGDLNSTFTP